MTFAMLVLIVPLLNWLTLSASHEPPIDARFRLAELLYLWLPGIETLLRSVSVASPEVSRSMH